MCIRDSLRDYRERLGIRPADFVLLGFGGSRGADKINSVMTEAAKALSGMEGVRVYFITGGTHFEKITEELKAQGIPLSGSNITVMPYADNIHEYLLASDLVVSRAGALTVSEITACGRASILIPSPNVTGNHQYYNAKVVADAGGAVLIEEKDLTGEKLISSILRLRSNKEALNAMSKASAQLGRTDAADVIYDHLGL